MRLVCAYDEVMDGESQRLQGAWKVITLDVLLILMLLDATLLYHNDWWADALQENNFHPTFGKAFLSMVIIISVSLLFVCFIPGIFRLGRKGAGGNLSAFLCSAPASIFILVGFASGNTHMTLSELWAIAASFKLVKCESLKEFLPLWFEKDKACEATEAGCTLLFAVWSIVQGIVFFVLPFYLLYKLIVWIF